MERSSPIADFEAAATTRLGPPAPANSPREVGAVWSLRGLEVALVRDEVPPGSLRRIWNERKAGRGQPLLVVAPVRGNGDTVVAIGPRDAVIQTPFYVEPEALAQALASIRHLAPGAASRNIEQALDTLSSAAAPGVLAHGLLTDHYVRQRLPRQPAFRSLSEWAMPAKTAVPGWRERLEAIGYSLTQLREGYLASAGGRPVLLVHVYNSPEAFARMDEHGRLPEGALIAECEREDVDWGILASGDRMRLFQARAERGAATDRWLEIEPSRLEDERSYLVGFFAPGSLGAAGLLPDLMAESRNFGADLYERVDDQIRRHALPRIAAGLGEWLVSAEGKDLHEPEVRREIQQACYTLLFRLLFVLYAESAGYLPYARSATYRAASARELCNEARNRRDTADPRSSFLWGGLQRLSRAMATGDRAMSLPAYNGSLFSSADLPGAGLLERAAVSDAHLVPALDAIGFDYTTRDDDIGLDYAQLEIGHLGAIYEGLLALRLSLADQTYRWHRGRDRFVPADDPGQDGVAAGQLFFQTEVGGRKGGGVYYTRQELVRHLVNQSVLPALEEHLDQVRKQAAENPEDAARLLFRFRVLDPAMGSAHFLVDALDVISDRVQTFLAETPLPAVRSRLEELRTVAQVSVEQAEDGRLLRRLLLKHCIYGVDLSEMATELGRIALWLASFVPGLALSYLDHNIRQGNALVGVASPQVVVDSVSGRRGGAELWAARGGPLYAALERAAELAHLLTDHQDKTPEEVGDSRRLQAELSGVLEGAQRLFDTWTAEPFGVRNARRGLIHATEILAGNLTDDLMTLLEYSSQVGQERHFFHWPLAFPEVFHPSSERNPGFDAIIGNPPWDEITVERLGFFALHDPGLRGLTSRAEQDRRISALLARFEELAQEFEDRRLELGLQRAFFQPENGYEIQGGGDLDLYQLFCERYQSIARAGGRFGVVLPRSTFITEGSRGFRRWLFGECNIRRIDLNLNNRSWAFPIHPQYTISLLAGEVQAPPKGSVLAVSGPSRDVSEFLANTASSGVTIALDELAAWTPAPPDSGSTLPTWELPLLPTQEHVRLFGQLRRGPRFDAWGRQHGGVFPATELHETQQRGYFRHTEGVPVWKGASFDQYDPHAREIAGYADWNEVSAFLQNKRAHSSTFRRVFTLRHLADPATHPVNRARVAFRDVTNRTNSRTVLACLIPPHTPLTNKAPYLVFVREDARLYMFALGILNSLPFDWQARRLVETNLNFFILNMLSFPTDETRVGDIAARTARLSCIDERYVDFAKEAGVDYGPLAGEEQDRLRAEVDALIAQAYGLTGDDLRFMFTDFTLDAVPSAYRDLVIECYQEFA
jgi:hypothetical protein